MEIDLNHVVSEVERAARCNGDCNKKGDGCVVYCFPSLTSSCSSNISSPMAYVSSSIYKELWHACAGPLTTLPKKGNVVVYFPQCHLEQAASASPFPYIEVPNFDLKPQIFCRIMDVQVLANKENDEVYTQLTLLPASEATPFRPRQVIPSTSQQTLRMVYNMKQKKKDGIEEVSCSKNESNKLQIDAKSYSGFGLASPTSSTLIKRSSTKRHNSGIDLNKKPRQKPRLKRHIPKVLDENKPKRTPKAKMPKSALQPQTPPKRATSKPRVKRRSCVRNNSFKLLY